MSIRDQEIKQFLVNTGYGDMQRIALQSDASFRRYERLIGNERNFMLMDAPPQKETVAPFVYVDQYLKSHQINAPAIYAQDISKGFLILEDFGDESYTKLLQRQENAVQEYDLYQAALDVLLHLKKQPLPKNLPYYDTALYLKEAQLLTDWYMPNVKGNHFSEHAAKDYIDIWTHLLNDAKLDQDTVVLRDYHADNLMWLPQHTGIARVGLLDFQDAVIGSPLYDVISLLEDARRDINPITTQYLIEYYLKASALDKQQFEYHYALLAAQRNCKIIGIFSRLAVRDHKPRYLNYLPRVWGHLDHDLQHPALRPLKQWLDTVMKKEQRDAFIIPNVKKEGLV